MILETTAENRKSLLDQNARSDSQFENKRNHGHSLLSDEADDIDDKFTSPQKVTMIGPNESL